MGKVAEQLGLERLRLTVLRGEVVSESPPLLGKDIDKGH